MPDSLGPKIRAARIRIGLGLRAAAARAKVSPGYWCDLEKGNRRNPSFQALGRVAGALGLTVEELLQIPMTEDGGEEVVAETG